MGLFIAYKTYLANYVNTLILSHYFSHGETIVLPTLLKSLRSQLNHIKNNLNVKIMQEKQSNPKKYTNWIDRSQNPIKATFFSKEGVNPLSGSYSKKGDSPRKFLAKKLILTFCFFIGAFLFLIFLLKIFSIFIS